VKGILTFQNRYPSVKQIKLEENFRSSKGIVETAREFIEKNPDRLPKKMQPTDAQDYEEGDIVALSFDTPELEAQHIVQSIKTLHGVAVKEPTDKDPHHKRGLAYSDMAVLFRSVDKNAEAVSRAFDQAHIPYIIVGMNNLFTTAEAEAARQLFYFMDALPAVDNQVSRRYMDERQHRAEADGGAQCRSRSTSPTGRIQGGQSPQCPLTDRKLLFARAAVLDAARVSREAFGVRSACCRFGMRQFLSKTESAFVVRRSDSTAGPIRTVVFGGGSSALPRRRRSKPAIASRLAS
jgi:hypothetical protein